ncbi:CASC3/Barentsz eIF4AIII binding domain-containing protein [Trichoderma velutinum]
MAAAPRRRKLIGQRRRVEDEGDDEGRPETLELDDDSLTEGSVISDDHDGADDSDTSNIDEVSPTSPNARKSANGTAKGAGHRAARAGAQGDGSKSVSDTELMLHGLSIADRPDSAQELQFDEVTPSPPKSPSAPVIVSSSSAMRPQPAQPANRRRQEHEDYKRRRDEDPAFVPNRGSFFMHDHRHPGPAANGFRPFGRGRGRGGGRGGIGGPYAPMNNHLHHPADPTTNSPWTHDMHETVADVIPRRPRQAPHEEGPPNGNGFIPTCEPSATPINRTLSTEKHIGNAQVRVILPEVAVSKVFPGFPVKQYTKLPDHRPPLRRDKPVRISLPNHPPRYIFPASDRSFTFIPRALRPNQQRLRGKPRSAWGSVGGFSRRTSIFGGSYYGGSIYSPSAAVSRRSSIVVHDREAIFSPTGSIISRPAPQADTRPVVRLPPAPQTFNMPPAGVEMPTGQPEPALMAGQEASIVDMPQPQTHPLPQKPNFQENLPTSIPMHQPRPQKNISVAGIESPTLTQNAPAFQQAFHQQVPVQMANGFQDSHARRPSYSTHVSTGTPLSQIPERAIHAAPFQPNTYGQTAYYGGQPYQPHPQQGYYYPHGYSGPSMPASAVTAPPFIPQGQPGMPGSFTPQNPVEQLGVGVTGPPAPPNTNLVAQEVNGMVYYYDASQLPSVNSYQPYPASQPYQPSVMGMGGMVTPSPDGFYYPQPAPGMVYYSQ